MPLDALNVLLSLIAADALGAPTEFKSPKRIEREYGLVSDDQAGSVFGFLPGEATDDSQMVVATLQGYARKEGDAGVLNALRAWLASGPPDIGTLTRQALSAGRMEGGVWAWKASGHDSTTF